MSIEIIAAAVRYGSLAIDRLAPELRERVERYLAGEKVEGEEDESEI